MCCNGSQEVPQRVVSLHLIKLKTLYCPHDERENLEADKQKVWAMAACARQGKRAKVILSNVTNVYSNLALEHWILNNWRFSKFDCLFVYRNEPCVVVGRFQNTWREINVSRARREGVNIARRVSGGGTVYHDLGNVNFSFFTDKPSHCPAKNLQFLSKTLNDRHRLAIDPNKRHDLFIGDKKISGSASRIIRTGSFHHCTLLVNSDLVKLSGLLHGDKTLKGTATASVPSPTTSILSVMLRDLISQTRDVISTSHIIDLVAEKYLSLYCQNSSVNVDLWSEECNQVTENNVILVDKVPDKILDPHHESFEWIFGRSPKFSKEFEVFGNVYTVNVEKGLVRSINDTENCELVGQRYDPEVIHQFLSQDHIENIL